MAAAGNNEDDIDGRCEPERFHGLRRIHRVQRSQYAAIAQITRIIDWRGRCCCELVLIKAASIRDRIELIHRSIPVVGKFVKRVANLRSRCTLFLN